MSSERKASGAASSEVQTDDTEQDSEVAQVLLALNRLDATIRGERDTLARLRGALRDMAGLLHHFKWSMRQSATEPLDIGTLLDELEHRVDAMLGLSRESTQVPTVSGVVSQLGRGEEAPPEVAQRQGPTVSELTAMVQALSASVPAAPEAEPPQAEAPATEPAISAVTPAAEAVAAPVDAVEAEPAPAPPPAEPEADDLAAFLFGPDLPTVTGEWKAQAPGPTPALPTVDLVAGAPWPALPKTSSPQSTAAPEKKAADPDDDPLAPLNAMSEWERLALFS